MAELNTVVRIVEKIKKQESVKRAVNKKFQAKQQHDDFWKAMLGQELLELCHTMGNALLVIPTIILVVLISMATGVVDGFVNGLTKGLEFFGKHRL